MKCQLGIDRRRLLENRKIKQAGRTGYGIWPKGVKMRTGYVEAEYLVVGDGYS